MKKELKAVICVVLAVWFFVMGFEIGSYHEKKEFMSTTVPSVIKPIETSASYPQYDTTASIPMTESTAATTAPSQPETTFPGISTTAPTETTKAPENDPSTLTKAQILSKVTEAINKLKSEPNFTAKRTESTTINVTECSSDTAKNVLNSMIPKFAGEKIANYTFVNGQATGVDENGKAIKDEGVVTPKDVIPPTTALFTLSQDGVKDATAVKNGDGAIYTIKLVEEKTVAENPIPNHNSKAIGYLNLTDIKLPGSTITQANMHYPESIVTVTVDGKGRALNIHYYMPMDGDGAAKMPLVSGTASFEGSHDEVWEIVY